MKNLIVPAHRVDQVVNALYKRWSERIEVPGKRDRKPFAGYVDENEGMFGCYAAFCVNSVVYIDSELYGQFNSNTDLLLVAQVMELQSKWASGDYQEALNDKIKSLA